MQDKDTRFLGVEGVPAASPGSISSDTPRGLVSPRPGMPPVDGGFPIVTPKQEESDHGWQVMRHRTASDAVTREALTLLTLLAVLMVGTLLVVLFIDYLDATFRIGDPLRTMADKIQGGRG